MRHKKIEFNAPSDYDAAASVYGEILIARGYKPPPCLEMYVLEEDVKEICKRLDAEGVPFREVSVPNQ